MSSLADTITIINKGQVLLTRILVRVGGSGSGGNGGEEWREVLPATPALPYTVYKNLDRMKERREGRTWNIHLDDTLGIWPACQASMIWIRENVRYIANARNSTMDYIATLALTGSDSLSPAHVLSVFLNETLAWIVKILSWTCFIVRSPVFILIAMMIAP